MVIYGVFSNGVKSFFEFNFTTNIPGEGCAAYDIALKFSIPPEKIEAVFCNGRVINIYDTIFPGDRVGFFPNGTPGPYRVFLGIARESRERARREMKVD